MVNTSRAMMGPANKDDPPTAAIAGVGVSYALSYQVAGALKRGELQLLLSDFEPAPWPVHLLHKPHPRLPLKLRAFLDFAGPRLRQRLAKSTIK